MRSKGAAALTQPFFLTGSPVQALKASKAAWAAGVLWHGVMRASWWGEPRGPRSVAYFSDCRVMREVPVSTSPATIWPRTASYKVCSPR